MNGLLCLTWNNHHSAFLRLLSTLLMKDSLSDATIVCHGKYFHVHQLVLSTCSEYFEEIFEETKCKQPIIIIKDVKPRELEALLSYMYKGEVNVSQEHLPDLIKAAEGLRIKGLAVPDDIPNPSWEKKRLEESRKSPPPSPTKRRKISLDKSNEFCQEVSLDQDNTVSKISSTNNVSNLQQSENNSDHALIGSSLECKSEIIEDYSCHVHTGIEDPLRSSDSITTPVMVDIKVESNDASGYGEDLTSEAALDSFTTSQNHLENAPLPIDPFSTQDAEDQLSSYSLMPQGVFGDGTGLSKRNLSSSHSDDLVPNSSSSSKPYTCTFCSHESHTPSGMKLHYLYKHSKREKPFACNVCPYRSYYKGDLLKHKRKHTGEKPFKCPFCPHRATQKHHIEHHMRRHTGEKPFACPHCPYKGNTKTNLQFHLLKHTDKPNNCVECGFVFYSKKEFFEHSKIHGSFLSKSCATGNARFLAEKQ